MKITLKKLLNQLKVKLMKLKLRLKVMINKKLVKNLKVFQNQKALSEALKNLNLHGQPQKKNKNKPKKQKLMIYQNLLMSWIMISTWKTLK